MSLNQEEREAIVIYRLEKAAKTLEEQDVLPLFAPTEQLIVDVAQEARECLKKNL